MSSQVQGCAPHHPPPCRPLQFVWFSPFPGDEDHATTALGSSSQNDVGNCGFSRGDLPKQAKSFCISGQVQVEELCQKHTAAEQEVSRVVGSHSSFGLDQLPFHCLLHLTSTSSRCRHGSSLQRWTLYNWIYRLLKTKLERLLENSKEELCCRNNPQMETVWLDGEHVLPATDGHTLINPFAWANTCIICIGAIYTSLTLE